MIKLGLILSLLLITTISSATETPEKLTRTQAIEDLKLLCSIMTKEYAYLKFKEEMFSFKWDKLCLEFEQLLANYKDNLIPVHHFNQMLKDLIGRLNDYHTEIGTIYNEQGSFLDVGIHYVEGQYWLYRGNDEIYKKLNLSRDEFKRKIFIVKSINNYSVDELLSFFPRSTYSNQLLFKTSAASHLGGLTGANYLDYLNAFGKLPFNTTQLITLNLFSISDNKNLIIRYSPITKENNQIDNNSSTTNVPCNEKYDYQFNIIEPGIGFLKIPTWYIENDEETSCIIDFLDDTVQYLRDNNIKKLIIDVRENGGGNSFWKILVSNLMSKKEISISNIIKFHKPSFEGYFENEYGIPHQQYQGQLSPLWFTEECKSLKYTNMVPEERNLILKLMDTAPLSHENMFSDENWSNAHFCFLYQRKNPLKAKIAVLIDRYGYSSNDQFISAMKSISSNDVVLIGEQTRGGSGGGGSFFLKHSNFRVKYAVFANWAYQGKIIENFGATPDIFVTWSIDDLITQNDPFVKKAVEWLNGSKMNKSIITKSLYKTNFHFNNVESIRKKIIPEL